MNNKKGKNVIKLIGQNNQGKLIINNEALEFIQNLNDHVGVIVAVGKKRLGKSFMLNRLVDFDSQNGFEISHIDEPCTKGIFMSTKIIDHSNKNGDKMKLILLDTEGLESKESSKEWDCKIFVLSLLMSSYLIYNTNGTYTRDDLEKLSFVTKISQNIRKNSSSEMDKNDFPELLWVCRDYKFEIKNDDAGRDALKEFMKTHFETDNLNKTKDFFNKSFKNIDGFYLPYPDLEHKNGLSSKKLLLGIESYKWDDFSGEFYDQLNILCHKIRDNVQIKMFNRKKLKGNIFSEFIRKVVEDLNNEKTILVVDLVEVLIKSDANRNLDEIKKYYSDKLEEFFSELPMEWKLMNSLEEKTRNECLDDLKKKIEESYLKEYEDLFKSYSLNEKDQSGIFFAYIRKNKLLIEKLCNEEFQRLETEYKARMNEKLSNGIFIENFECYENDLSNKILSEFKEKVKEFSTNRTEPVIEFQIFEDKLKILRENSDFSNMFLENYLENEWLKIFDNVSNNYYVSLEDLNTSIGDFKKRYLSLSVKTSKKDLHWSEYQRKYFYSLKDFLETKLKLSEKSSYYQPANTYDYSREYSLWNNGTNSRHDMLNYPQFLRKTDEDDEEDYDEDDEDDVVFYLKRMHKNSEYPKKTNEDETVKCEICSKTFKNQRGLAIHKGHKHKNSQYPRKTDEDDGENDEEDDDEDDGEDDEDETVKCEICSKTFKNQRGLAIHMGHKHKNSQYPRKTDEDDGEDEEYDDADDGDLNCDPVIGIWIGPGIAKGRLVYLGAHGKPYYLNPGGSRCYVTNNQDNIKLF